MAVNPREVAKLIDHTLLKADASLRDIEQLCEEAVNENFFSVCINPFWVKRAADLLEGEAIKVCTVIGFPLGADDLRGKICQAEVALEQGARELDMVINLGSVKSGEYRIVEEEVMKIREIAKDNVVKVIIETCFLEREEKIRLCRIAEEYGADFVKTSTGFGSEGALLSDVKLMRKTVSPGMGIKASGGIRSYEALVGMVKAGANRIGSSSGVKIMGECRQKSLKGELK